MKNTAALAAPRSSVTAGQGKGLYDTVMAAGTALSYTDDGAEAEEAEAEAEEFGPSAVLLLPVPPVAVPLLVRLLPPMLVLVRLLLLLPPELAVVSAASPLLLLLCAGSAGGCAGCCCCEGGGGGGGLSSVAAGGGGEGAGSGSGGGTGVFSATCSPMRDRSTASCRLEKNQYLCVCARRAYGRGGGGGVSWRRGGGGGVAQRCVSVWGHDAMSASASLLRLGRQAGTR